MNIQFSFHNITEAKKILAEENGYNGLVDRIYMIELDGNRTKIGCSSATGARIKTHHASSVHYGMEITGVAISQTLEKGHKIEKAIFKRLKDYASFGTKEIFSLPIDAVIDMMQDFDSCNETQRVKVSDVFSTKEITAWAKENGWIKRNVVKP